MATFTPDRNYPDWEYADEAMRKLVAELKVRLGLEGILDEMSREEGFALTAAGYLMLLGPLIDAANSQRIRQSRGIRDKSLDLEANTVLSSLDKLITYTGREPARADSIAVKIGRITGDNGELALRSSLSVIKAYAAQFCDIPPFCGETE